VIADIVMIAEIAVIAKPFNTKGAKEHRGKAKAYRVGAEVWQGQGPNERKKQRISD